MNAMIREEYEAPVLTNEAIEVHLNYLRAGFNAMQAALPALRRQDRRAQRENKRQDRRPGRKARDIEREAGGEDRLAHRESTGGSSAAEDPRLAVRFCQRVRVFGFNRPVAWLDMNRASPVRW